MSWHSRAISRPALYTLALGALMILFFQSWRLFALIRQWDLGQTVPAATLLESFLVGARFDISIAAGAIIPLYLLSIIPGLDLVRQRWFRWVYFTLLTLIASALFLLHVFDIEFFAFFHSRLNGMALSWKQSQDILLSMIWQTYPVIRYLLLAAVMTAAFVFAARRLMTPLLLRPLPSPVWANLIWLPLVLVLLIVGVRGRLAVKTPIRTGVAYFSAYQFANQLALNPVFTFLRDAVYDARERNEINAILDAIEVPDKYPLVANLLNLPKNYRALAGGKFIRPVSPDTVNPAPPNIIVVVMESFGATRIGSLDNRWPYDMAPCFDSLADEGLLFTRFYSSGMHTYAGLFSVLTGCPHQCTELVMKGVAGQAHFWTLAHMLRLHHYRTLFFLTHDPHFDNMHGFAAANGFERTVSSLDYTEEQLFSTWGVPDHVMFDRAVEELRTLPPQPFFALMLTTSNHGPWLVPDVPFARIPDTADRADELNAFRYSDWALGRFVRAVQNDPLLQNTIIVVTADNGVPFRVCQDMDLTQYHVPCLIVDTDRRVPEGKRIDRLGGHYDIPATVMGLTGLPYDNFTFGHDLLDTASTCRDYAHFSEWFNVGYLEGDYFFIYRHDGAPRSLLRIDDPCRDIADSLPQTADRYQRQALALFKTSYYNQRLPLPEELVRQVMAPVSRPVAAP